MMSFLSLWTESWLWCVYGLLRRSENLHGIDSTIGARKLEAMPDFEHGQNVGDRCSFGQPLTG
jgi:hypothetical protein